MKYFVLHNQVDLQTCILRLESWSHTSTELSLQWREDDIAIKEKNETMNQHDFQVEFLSNVGGHYSGFNGSKTPRKIN